MALKILLADDSAFMRKVLKNTLEKQNKAEVVGEASNGAEAIEKYGELAPDLVFMDIVMPEVTGIDAVKGIMKDHPDATIIMCSSMGQDTMINEALEAGAEDFIVKPFKEEKILEIIEKHTQ